MNKILDARERRSRLIQEKLKQSNLNLISIKANVIGVNKNPYYAYLLVNVILKLFIQQKAFVIEKISFYDDFDGPFYLLESSSDSIFLKKKCIEIEETFYLGRLVDLDVYSDKQISRRELGLKFRKCLICNNDAIICMRTNLHSNIEIEERISCLIRNFLESVVVRAIDKAITLEADLNPKFGLVSKITRGSHLDMDYNLLMASKAAIIGDLKKMFFLGLDNDLNDGFLKARDLGLETEAKMYDATKGVNTYKGLIFILGIVLVALGNAIKNVRSDLFNFVKEIGKDLINELNPKLETFGGYAYNKYGFLGARGEVFRGLENVRKAKVRLKDFTDESLTLTLIYLVGNVEDTVLLKRSKTIEKYNYYKNLVASIKSYDLDLINSITNECIENNISFGGSADLLIATIFIKIIEEELGIIYE